MKLTSPTLGPILGHTTPGEARIWFRGQFTPDGADGYRRCFGAVRYREPGKAWSTPRVGKLSPNFDVTGVFPLQKLQPDTAYEYQAGWFHADSEIANAAKIPTFEWDNLEAIAFRTPAGDDKRTHSVIVGSCRYLLRLFGGRIFDDRGDKAFSSILEKHRQAPIDSLLMVGDQIYADDLSVLSPDQRIDQFLARYRAVFSQEHVRRLMARVPTYMILDDHEIEDNWPIKASEKDMTTLYPHAMHAYQIYQCSHSPVFSVDKDGWITGTPSRFWYTFNNGCADWFVMDVRTERIWSEDPARRQMVKSAQMDALLRWLSDGSGRAKMIVSSVPFIPDLESDSNDKWGAYLPERTRILDYILENRIRKVAFVSGDVHCSFTTQITSPADRDFKVLSIISSSFFWPYPHMEQSDFSLKGKLETTGNNTYTLGKSSPVYSTDNFARLDIRPDGIDVAYFDRKGRALGRTINLAF